ncbi:ABC transporter ATP-binding protein [Halorhabdus sp. CBA1104]|uniref:ABC transporter ATP-binding protein n=1 Tax=Halorhabdus sp. CBA1104 TaxID=1380432 RepID=UPI0012B1C481|nr:ABC transporter ATP-binding protein [Halorhabdus sp. CBA1104]QGN06458.1 ABC transporter ATP-binding protein [Halorhabdus sp. CBA1104]
MTAQTPQTLTVQNLRREYGPIVALDGVSLAVEPGTLHCLVGPNGSGKTTLFRILLGLVQPTDGVVTRPEATVGVGFQRPSWYPDLTVAENVRVFGRLMDVPADGWQAYVLDVLGLDRVRHRRAGALSGGYGKKLDLALAVLKRPRFLLLDEPLADLDDVAESQFLDFLASYAEAGNAVFVSTHRIADFATVLDRLTVLERGHVIFDATSEELATDDRSMTEVYAELIRPGEPGSS